ncbi:MAG: ABC transporter ATP-binding protein [Longispora sp.]|nr:ABC transporter ATP-binding protein [Longispora sp. (in: high G+C Gram-positive bacteria)]
MLENACELRGLVKTYGIRPAVAGVNLDIPVGSFYGLLGPNGAGKTTALSMATGLLRPDAGTARILGRDVWQDPHGAKQLLGVLSESSHMFDRLSGRELLTYTGLLRGMPAEEIASRSTELLHVLGLNEAGAKQVIDYSTGMKKKIALACALLHGPRVLVLDEPFEAVDPVSASMMRDILQRFVTAGGTVIFSSHVMEVVERLCSHVAILVNGEVRAAGTLDQVRGGSSLEDVFVHLSGGRLSLNEGLAWLA